MSKHIKTKKEEIYEYWFSKIDESELSVDASEALNRCWRCGYERKLERCQIIPRSLGGEDTSSNFVLLCKRCHSENPNVNDPEIMWDWLKAYKETLYDMFWIKRGLEEYEKIYKTKFYDDIKSYDENISIEDAKKLVSELISSSASNHFAQPYLNSATMAGFLRILLKKIMKERDNT
ncbi:HNH endonuclease [Helcococcus kunzii]|uniref:HNH endonuclease n=1 Tax=Helcococcus kunzii TaxID=40091 RepID=UPI0021A68B96|nr:HNH endonuclease signature motif containing protein [Helcococcus kunzii]MCT1796902.1 HNH endonuclease [Helcococcus kunzii]MCT1989905.1 HNH endonuclease [Helcococcus kunzii]